MTGCARAAPRRRRARHGPRRSLAATLTALLLLGCDSGVPAGRSDGASDGAAAAADTANGYERLVALFGQWRDFQRPEVVDGVPDYTPDAMREQADGLGAFRRRLAAIDTAGWSVEHRIDYRLVEAEMNGLAFDHRVLRPWARNPTFYAVLHASDTDVPAREGEVMVGAIELWQYEFPLGPERTAELRAELRAVPAILEQARANLVEDAADLWTLGVRQKEDESRVLASLSERLAEVQPELVDDADRARRAVDAFRAWLAEEQAGMDAPSGVGRDEYTWYLRHVQLVPYSWEEEVAIVERELGRAWSSLKLLEARDRGLPELEIADTEEEYHAGYVRAVHEFVDFLERVEFFTVPDYAESALLAREGRFIPPDEPHEFFSQVDYRDQRPMRAHGTHWLDRARMEHDPNPSPIRRAPLLYNIWASRAEGLATAMEEMSMRAGYLDDSPRARELVYVLLAQRAARALAALKMHANELTLDEAVDFAVERTPRGWMPRELETVWGEQGLYLTQPSYGTSYVVGKAEVEALIADRARQLGDDFRLRDVMDAFHAAGLIPVSMIRWQMTGREDELPTLR